MKKKIEYTIFILFFFLVFFSIDLPDVINFNWKLSQLLSTIIHNLNVCGLVSKWWNEQMDQCCVFLLFIFIVAKTYTNQWVHILCLRISHQFEIIEKKKKWIDRPLKQKLKKVKVCANNITVNIFFFSSLF